MATIELSPEELGELRSILEVDLSDLRMEIADTDNWEFRDGLKKREAFLERLVKQLRAQGG